MIVRRAVEGDAGAIAAIHSHYVCNTQVTFTSVEKSPADWRNSILADASVLVAEEEGHVVGFATFGPFRTGPGYAATAEHSVYLAAGGARRGLGRALMAAVEVAAQAAGVHVLVAAISGTNLAARAFHARLGFEETGRMPEVGRKHGEYLDLILMQKFLRKSEIPTDSGEKPV